MANESGMTLLELMISLAVAGLMVAIGYGALGFALDHRQRMLAGVDELQEVARVRNALNLWLAGAYLTGESEGPLFQGLDRLEGSQYDDLVSFPTAATTPLGPVPTIARLYIDRDEQTLEQGLVMDLSEWPTGCSLRLELVPEAQGLNVRYLMNDEGERAWLQSWISGSTLPVGMALHILGPTGSVPPLLELPFLISIQGAR
jgi:prepilin-type N-terminal cleavage/methylation domain-containing protein